MPDRIRLQFNRLTAGVQNVWVYLGVALAFGSVAAFAMAEAISQNTFLRSFLPQEYLPTIIVLVTVTLASIVNIHVKLTMMTDSLGKGVQPMDEKEVGQLRRKANDVAMFFLVIPVAAFVILIVDGSLPTTSEARAWTFSALVALFFAATAATYEVQRVVIKLYELPERH